MNWLPSRHSLRGVRLGVTYGALWGVAIAAGEALVLPFGQLASPERFMALGPIWLMWALTGVMIANVALAAEPFLDRPWKVALAIVVTAIAVSCVHECLLAALDGLGLLVPVQRLLGAQLPSWTNFFYMVWMTLFFGGQFIIACVLMMRAERTRQALGEAQIARNKTEAVLDAVRLEALRTQFDPAFLLHTLDVVGRRQAADPGGADALLEELVVFLRLAMPGVRSGRSTLRAETALAQSYARITAASLPTRPAWRIIAVGEMPEMPFPPRLLLPVMEALARPHAEGGDDTLRIQADGSRVEVRFEHRMPVAAASLAEALLYRIRVALQTSFAKAFLLEHRPAGPRGPAAFVIEIDHHALALTAAPERGDVPWRELAGGRTPSPFIAATH